MTFVCSTIESCPYQVFTLCQDFTKGLDLKTTLAAIAIIYIIFLRKWGLKKIGSFLLALFFFFIAIVCINSFLGTLFWHGYDAQLTTVSRIIFIFIGLLIFLYYAALKD